MPKHGRVDLPGRGRRLLTSQPRRPPLGGTEVPCRSGSGAAVSPLWTALRWCGRPRPKPGRANRHAADRARTWETVGKARLRIRHAPSADHRPKPVSRLGTTSRPQPLTRGRNPGLKGTRPRDASREQLVFKALLPSRIRCTKWRFRPPGARCSPGFSTSPGLSTPTPRVDAATDPPLTGLARKGRRHGGNDSSSGDPPKRFSWLPHRVSVSAGAGRSLTRPADPHEVRCLFVQRP